MSGWVGLWNVWLFASQCIPKFDRLRSDTSLEYHFKTPATRIESSVFAVVCALFQCRVFSPGFPPLTVELEPTTYSTAAFVRLIRSGSEKIKFRLANWDSYIDGIGCHEKYAETSKDK